MPDSSIAEKDTIKRPFQCTWPGCTNSYARSEHLNRHKLNHEPVKIYECEHCPKTFVRSDLLFRHKDRHARKAMKRNSPSNNSLKSIRPARSDSNSSREDAGSPYMTGRGAYSGSLEESLSLSRSLSHPRALLQSPFASNSSSQTPHSTSSFEEYASRQRHSTLPVLVPRAGQSSEVDHSVYSHTTSGSSQPGKRDSSSPTLPSIKDMQLPRGRTYSVESMLNRAPMHSTSYSESVIFE